MLTVHEGHTRFAATLAVKGTAFTMLGVAALVWSDATVMYAVLLASFIMMACGAYDIILGAQVHRQFRGWPILVFEGAASLGMAALGLGFTAAAGHTTLVLAALWLSAYGAMAGTLALAVWPMSRTRVPLIAWSAFNLLLSGMALSSGAGISTPWYAGATYALAFGAFQLSAAFWVRKFATPEVAPTCQSQWRVSAAR